MAWPSVRSWSEWTASGVTLGVLGLGYWQIRRERAQTQDAIELARETLEFERQARETEMSERHRELVAGCVIETISRRDERGKADVAVSVRNHSSLPMADVRAFVVHDGVHWSPKPVTLRPDGGNSGCDVPGPLTGYVMPPHPRSYGVTFRDGHARYWVRWGDGTLNRWDQSAESLNVEGEATRVEWGGTPD